MTEYTGAAPVPPPAFLHIFETAEFARFEEALELADWRLVEDMTLAGVVADRRTYVHTSASTGVRTILQVWDMHNNLGVELRTEREDGEGQQLFRSEWISANRMVAMLDVMGIARAQDAWMAWWRSEVWR